VTEEPVNDVDVKKTSDSGFPSLAVTIIPLRGISSFTRTPTTEVLGDWVVWWIVHWLFCDDLANHPSVLPPLYAQVARLNGKTARSLEPRVVAQVNEVMEKREESVCCAVAGNKIVPSMHDE
jgi:hypothetical protein